MEFNVASRKSAHRLRQDIHPQEDGVKRLKVLVITALACICLTASVTHASAQISISIGVAPVCPYGYFNYAPYSCAPFGYYGPQWFTGGVFLGAGPWFHGPVGFHGYVDRTYDPRFGYHGPFPGRGERADWGRHPGWEQHWHGNDSRVEVRHDNGNHSGQYKEHGNPHDDHGHGNPHDDHGHGYAHDDHDHGHGHDK
jgi:hypothetical protein